MIETLLERLAVALERNAALMEQALSGKAAEPAAEEPAADKPRRGRPPKTEPAKTKPVSRVDEINKVGRAWIAEDPKAAKEFMKAVCAHLGVEKLVQSDPEHHEAILVWLEAAQKGVKVDFRADLDDIRNAEPEEDDEV